MGLHRSVAALADVNTTSEPLDTDSGATIE